MNRAYSLLTIRSVDDDARIIRGIATTPATDRIGDVVEPKGAEFSLPLPLLWQHDSMQPIGHVTGAKVTSDGIEVEANIQRSADPGALKDRLDEAWQSIKLGLVRGFSIGFQPLEVEPIKGTFGLRFLKWAWHELSAVTIPANAEATIQTIKSACADIKAHDEVKAATGQEGPTVTSKPPGVSGNLKTRRPPQEGKSMKTIAEQITALEAKRLAHSDRMEVIMKTTSEEGRTSTEAEQEEFDNLEAEVDTIDKDLRRLRKLEAMKATVKASPIVVASEKDASEARSVQVSVKAEPKLEPGIGYARLVKVKAAAKLAGEPALTMAQRMYGPNSEVVGIITKANEVVAGTTLSGNWAYDLISQEGAAVAAFLEYLRPQTILGKFGTGGIPALRRLDFYTPYVTQTGAGTAYWVGEGKPKPLTSFDYDRSTLTPLKIANICVLTEENIRYSSPNSDTLVRDQLAKAIAQGLDEAFIDPSNSGSANVKPASVTNGAQNMATSGNDADDVRFDVRVLFQMFIDDNNAPTSGVWVMSNTNALALSMMVNALGQPEFPTVTMNGGTFQGLPVIASQNIGGTVALINASDIFLGDEGGVAVDMSREASIEMRSTGLGMDATAGTATTGSVSMFQTNSVALRAERTISWKRARSSAVAYITGVEWGGDVSTI